MQFGLLGKSLGYSFSAAYFKAKFQAQGLMDHHYRNCEIPEVKEFLKLLQEEEWAGFNVTIPYKEQIIPYLADLDTAAQAIGAVNTLVPYQGNWKGFNTDYLGFQKAIQKAWPGVAFHSALVLGTGGASKAVAYALGQMGCRVQMVSRKPTAEEWSYQVAQNNLAQFKLIVNSTPLGTWPNIDECPALEPIGDLRDQYFMDLIYNPKETKWLSKARSQGAQILNGESMLRWQAEYAWELWQAAQY